MKDYSWVTNELFDEKLKQLVGQLSGDEMLAIPGIMEILREELNNKVLEELAVTRDDWDGYDEDP